MILKKGPGDLFGLLAGYLFNVAGFPDDFSCTYSHILKSTCCEEE